MKLEISSKFKQGDFDFAINTTIEKDTVGIFGASGAGKSTLLHLISGLKRPDQGQIILNNKIFVDTNKKIFVPPHKRGIGLVFQDGRLFPHMSVKKNLLFGSKRKSSKRLDFNHVIKILELEHLLKRRPGNLSGGERQRVAIGRALLSAPEILLLDEPFSAIDTSMRLDLLPFISRIHNEYNIPLLMISHDLPELLHLTDHLMIIENGMLLNQGLCTDLIFDKSCSRRLLNSGASSSFNGKLLARNKEDGTARIEIIPEKSQTAIPTKILGPYNESIKAGEYIRGRLAPEDIILSAAPVEYISAQNQIRALITRTISLEDRTLVEINAGGLILLTEVTNKSNSDFIYVPGRQIWALFKAWSVNYTLGKKHSKGISHTSKKSQIIQHPNKRHLQEA